MSKFYAQSGSRQIVISADDAADAAAKLVDHILGDHVWIYGDETLTQNDRRSFLAVEALTTLDATVVVSVRGVGRSDAGEFDTADLVAGWHRLMTGTSLMFGQGMEPVT